MNDLKLRAYVRQIIAEAKAKKDDKKADKKKEPKLPKSSGKLMDLKKEIAYLKEMSSQLQSTGLNEVEQDTKVEFANLQKFVSELAKVKEAGADLKKKLDDEIKSIEEKIKAEKAKIKEMIGLAEPKTGMGEEKVKEARFKKGEDIGKPGKGFEKIKKSAAKRYGSEEAGKKVAGAILKKVVKK
jgi:hypothetical protein